MAIKQTSSLSPIARYRQLIDRGHSHVSASEALECEIAEAEAKEKSRAIDLSALVARLKKLLAERGVWVPRHNDLKRLAGRCRTHQLIDRATFNDIINNAKGK